MAPTAPQPEGIARALTGCRRFALHGRVSAAAAHRSTRRGGRCQGALCWRVRLRGRCWHVVTLLAHAVSPARAQYPILKAGTACSHAAHGLDPDRCSQGASSRRKGGTAACQAADAARNIDAVHHVKVQCRLSDPSARGTQNGADSQLRLLRDASAARVRVTNKRARSVQNYQLRDAIQQRDARCV